MNSPTSLALAVLAWMAIAAMPWSPPAAAATIEAKLIYGTNADDHPKEQKLKELEKRFQPDFGYKHYRLLGEKSADLKEGDSVMLDLGQQFELSLKHKGAKKQFQVLQIDLFHKQKWLLYLEASVKQKGEPIFIKGPSTDEGLVIIAVAAKWAEAGSR